MKNKIVSALIGIMIGLPISVCAAEMRPGPAIYEPPVMSYRVERPVVQGEDIEEEEFQADLQLLACLVEAEAGGEDMTGKRLVADVVLNRVADPRFPDTIAGVIYEPGQFSPVTDGSLAEAYYTVSQDSFDAVAAELKEEIDYTILFFRAGQYGCGEPAFQYGHHYFSK